MVDEGDASILDFFRLGQVEHYYGDIVRQLFLATAALALVALPLLGDLLPFGLVVEVFAALLLVFLAGLTNPHSKMVLLYDAALAGIGAAALEITAVTYYALDPLFFAREAATILLLFAFYYSIKTIRARSMHTLGKRPRPWEFENEKEEE